MPSSRDGVLDDLFEALALGVKEYFVNARAFQRIGVALSGGRDSLLTLLVAWRAVQLLHPAIDDERLRSGGASELAAFYLPARFSEPTPRAAAERICEELGVPLRVVSIEEAVERERAATRCMLGGDQPTAITEQNIQSRIRAALHTRFSLEGIAMTLATVPGPELAEHQSAEAELMPFTVLNARLHLYAAEKLSLEEMKRVLPTLFPDLPSGRVAEWAERVVNLFTRAIYKWVQAPVSLHVGALDLDRERALQLPVIEQNEWSIPTQVDEHVTANDREDS